MVKWQVTRDNASLFLENGLFEVRYANRLDVVALISLWVGLVGP